MEYYEILGWAVDGLYANMVRISERDGTDNNQFKQINRKYIQVYNLYQKELIEHLAKTKK